MTAIAQLVNSRVGELVNPEASSTHQRVFNSPTLQLSVVVLLLPRRDSNLLVDRRFLAPRRAARRGFGGGVAALFAPADLLLRVQAFEDEIDRRCDERR